jgi:hypothetical protein
VTDSSGSGASSIATKTATVSAAAAAINCWDYYVTRSGKNLLGGTLFSVTTHTSWCGDGATIKTKATTTTTQTTAFVHAQCPGEGCRQKLWISSA